MRAISFIEFFGADRNASVSRELSKMFEENKRGTLKELADYFKTKTVMPRLVDYFSNHDLNP